MNIVNINVKINKLQYSAYPDTEFRTYSSSSAYGNLCEGVIYVLLIVLLLLGRRKRRVLMEYGPVSRTLADCQPTTNHGGLYRIGHINTSLRTIDVNG